MTNENDAAVEQVRHIRRIHFAVLGVCLALVSAAVVGSESEPQKAYRQLQEIELVTQRWYTADDSGYFDLRSHWLGAVAWASLAGRDERRNDRLADRFPRERIKCGIAWNRASFGTLVLHSDTSILSSDTLPAIVEHPPPLTLNSEGGDNWQPISLHAVCQPSNSVDDFAATWDELNRLFELHVYQPVTSYFTVRGGETVWGEARFFVTSRREFLEASPGRETIDRPALAPLDPFRIIEGPGQVSDFDNRGRDPCDSVANVNADERNRTLWGWVYCEEDYPTVSAPWRDLAGDTGISLHGQLALMQHFSMSHWRVGPFASAFGELRNVTRSYSELNFEQADSILVALARRSGEPIQLFGARIPRAYILVIGLPLLLVVQLYLILHLAVLHREYDTESVRFPWIGLYRDRLSRSVLAVSWFAPPISLSIIGYASQSVAPQIAVRSLLLMVTATLFSTGLAILAATVSRWSRWAKLVSR